MKNTRLPANNVTENVPKRDSFTESLEIDQSLSRTQTTGPVTECEQSKSLGGVFMTPEARRQYINLKRQRYQSCPCRKERGEMLQELLRDGIYKNIKSANRAMLEKSDIGSRIHERGRKPIFTKEVKLALKRVWQDAGMPNSLRLQAILGSTHWMDGYDFPFEVLTSLAVIGKTSIDEFTKPWRVELRRRSNSMTKPSDKVHLKGVITQRVPFVKVTAPGYLETDTVCHHGEHFWGDYGNTVNVTDVFTGWTQSRMIKGKTAELTVSALEVIFAKLPFNIAALYFDSGSEFLNYEMESRFGKQMTLQHSRPQRKNDQAHIEQKNDTHVRRLLGYDRYERDDVIAAVNDLYENEWSILNNFFMPQMKLKEKTRIKSKLRKYYDTPKTPLERLIESKVLTPEKEKELLAIRDAHNPVQLRKTVEQKIKRINELMQESDNLKKAG